MAKIALLLVDYGTNNSIHVGLFKEQLKKAGWTPGFLEGVFEKSSDLPQADIERALQEEFDSAANHAGFKRTCCEAFIAEDEVRFCWDWNTE
jgi:hypothetical protein